jgi:hypothetical protein
VKTGLALIGTAVTLALAFASTALAGQCTTVSGAFTSYTYFPPSCTAPIGICFHATLTGSLLASYDLRFQTFEPTGDPNDPTRYDFSGTSVLTTTNGRLLYGEDSGFLHMNSNGLSPFETSTTIVDGTKQYKDASGAARVRRPARLRDRLRHRHLHRRDLQDRVVRSR